MKILLSILAATAMSAATSVHEFTLKSIDGQTAPLAAYKGNAVLIVNVASQCGYTPQYAGLQALYEKYKDRGLVVIGVPANDFGGQEPGSDAEIKQFCTRNYKVTFPMMSKVPVSGANQTPLYRYLTGEKGAVKWNFTKFLAGKDGRVLAKFDSGVGPDSPELAAAVENALR